MNTMSRRWTITVQDEETVSLGDPIAQLDDATIAAQHAGKVRSNRELRKAQPRSSCPTKTARTEYEIPTTSRLLVRDGEHVDRRPAAHRRFIEPAPVLRINGRE
jgi:DNA-directed RNA polymerase subunit beta'